MYTNNNENDVKENIGIYGSHEHTQNTNNKWENPAKIIHFGIDTWFNIQCSKHVFLQNQHLMNM